MSGSSWSDVLGSEGLADGSNDASSAMQQLAQQISSLTQHQQASAGLSALSGEQDVSSDTMLLTMAMDWMQKSHAYLKRRRAREQRAARRAERRRGIYKRMRQRHNHRLECASKGYGLGMGSSGVTMRTISKPKLRGAGRL